MSAISLPKLPSIASSPIAVEVLNGLSDRPKTLSPWLFYDRAGSLLFEEITELPEYYVTRTEREILAKHADEIVSAAAEGRELSMIELGYQDWAAAQRCDWLARKRDVLPDRCLGNSA
jgi:L-histidine N-alpha-methyltransferase